MNLQTVPTPTIRYEDQGSKGRYSATVDGIAEEAELTISKVSDTLIIADHTAVPDSMRGLGVAKTLAEKLIADARDKGQRIVPLCPFVRSYAMKNKEAVADVIQW